MKTRLITVLVALVSLVGQSGCVSYVNHRRVLNNDAEAFIRSTGDRTTIKAVEAGVSPVKAIQTRILTSTSGEVDGAAIMFAPFELKTYAASYKENKVSYTAALIADILLGVATAAIIDSNSGGASSSGTSSSASASISVNGDGNNVVVSQSPIGGSTDSRDQSETPVVIVPSP